MRCIFVLFVLLGSTVSWSATVRALFIGVDQYEPLKPPEKPLGRGSWTNLDGAANDAISVREVLIKRYGIKPEHARLLQNTEATRENILSEIRSHLIAPSQKGDVCLFFYAGHGSQVKNSESQEPDRMDESIVPADSNQGVDDIRDKELRGLFNELVDKGVMLTVIFDSCHSGSVVRGLGKSRKLAPDLRDVKDPSDAGPAPEEKGALIFSAAQDYELAWEARDEEDHPHGAFSLALIRTLRSVDLKEPAENLFKRVKAAMQSEGRSQEPVMAGSAERRKMPLLGGAISDLSGITTVAVEKVDGEMILLQGGSAIHLAEGCELIKAGEANNRIRIRVASVEGPARSKAEVLEGELSAVQPGDLFQVDRWAISNEFSLRVWIPPTKFKQNEIEQINGEIAKLKAAGLRLVGDPTAEVPTHWLSWENDGWKLYSQNKTEKVGMSLAADSILQRLDSTAKLFVQLPPSQELLDAIELKNSSIEITSLPEDAHYHLLGRTDGKTPEYAWVLEGALQKEMQDSALPVGTDWIGFDKSKGPVEAAKRLKDLALRLGKIRAWLSLEPPPDEGKFPYQLALKNSKTGVIKTEGTVVEDESYGLSLTADPKRLEAGVEKRYVYVFTIDSYGNSTLLFPPSGRGNVENYVPYENLRFENAPAEIPLGRKALFVVGPPFGTDSYVLLTSGEPLPDPNVLEFAGVRHGTRGGGGNPLQSLLSGIGSATRGAKAVTPVDWSVQRLSIRSRKLRTEN